MKQKLVKNLVLILLCFIMLSGCLFQPDMDDNFNEIDSEIFVAPFEITLDQAADTIPVFFATDFSFSISNLDPSLQYDVRIFSDLLSGVSIYNKLSGVFNYSPPDLTGYDVLHLQVVIKSGTGSLADKLGAENIVFEQSWVLHVDTNPPDETVITSIKADDGSLRIEWPKYKRINFKNYRVNKIKENEYYSYVITDPDSSFFYDKSFVGGRASYQVVIESLSNTYSVSSTKTYEDLEVPTLIKYEQGSNSSRDLKIFFSSSRYPENISHYEVYETYAPNTYGGDLLGSFHVRDTVFSIEPVFGKSKYIYITTISKQAGNYPESVTSLPKEYTYGEKISPFEKILFSRLKNRYYSLASGSSILKTFSITTNEKIGEITLPNSGAGIQLSLDESKIIALVNDKVFFWDSQTLAFLEEIDFKFLLTAQEYIIGFGTANNNRLLLNKTSNSNNLGSLLLFDLNTRLLIKQFSGLSPSTNLELSIDEKFIRTYGYGFKKISSIKDDQISATGLTTTDLIFFNPQNQSQAILGYSSAIQTGSILISDILTWEVISRFYTQSMRVYSMDIESGLAAGLRENEFKYLVFDYLNQNILWEGQTYNIPIVHGNYIYSTEGVRLKIME
jgi:hypothetical protein